MFNTLCIKHYYYVINLLNIFIECDVIVCCFSFELKIVFANSPIQLDTNYSLKKHMRNC